MVSSGVQAPLLLPPPPPSPPPPVATNKPSAGREEPTDEELLETAQETPDLPAAVLPPPPPAASSKQDTLSKNSRSGSAGRCSPGTVLGGRGSSQSLSPWWYPPQPLAVYKQPPASPDPFFACCGQIAPPPQMPPVPSPVWLLTVYGYDVLMRLDEFKARITSTFGSILKMDSTKKVMKKLAGAASGTAAWATNAGNEHGQVLMSVLTCCEGSEGLSKMVAGLMRRYRLAEVPAPQLIYVDCDCCKQDGVSKMAALFPV
ncbi:uncharacterized protein [Nothobranchius furzeri]|uniref:uncharacterized protein n=1 Tax=Nothobranchius furzeri TaxID=105023 RepID=UPI00390482E6